MLGLVQAIFTGLDETTVTKLFTRMVRPQIEYGNVIRHSRFRCNKLEIEK